MTKVKPNFLIVGAAKAGTTALYYYLKQHKDIGFPNLKEPKYFSSYNLKFPHNGVGDASVDKYAIRDWEEYLELFKGLKGHKRIGEASPDYLFYHKQTAPLIKEKLGDIPIIIILRNPIKRAFSAYMYSKRDSRELLSFREAVDAEECRLKENWDFIWGYKKGGLYFEQLKTFLTIFTNVKIIFQEELKTDTNKVLKDVHSFLGVDDKFVTETSVKHNESGLPNNFISKFLLSRNNIISTTIRVGLKVMIPRRILEKVASRSLKKAVILEEDITYLKPYFYNDICNLERLINKDLSSWKS